MGRHWSLIELQTAPGSQHRAPELHVPEYDTTHWPVKCCDGSGIHWPEYALWTLHLLPRTQSESDLQPLEYWQIRDVFQLRVASACWCFTDEDCDMALELDTEWVVTDLGGKIFVAVFGFVNMNRARSAIDINNCENVGGKVENDCARSECFEVGCNMGDWVAGFVVTCSSSLKISFSK